MIPLPLYVQPPENCTANRTPYICLDLTVLPSKSLIPLKKYRRKQLVTCSAAGAASIPKRHKNTALSAASSMRMTMPDQLLCQAEQHLLSLPGIREGIEQRNWKKTQQQIELAGSALKKLQDYLDSIHPSL